MCAIDSIFFTKDKNKTKIKNRSVHRGSSPLPPPPHTEI